MTIFATRSSALVVMLAAASGCSSLLHRDVQPTQLYVLRAVATPQASELPAEAPTLRIGRTLAAPGLDSDRIVLMQTDRRMDHYAASRWAGPLPEVVEALAVQTLRSSGAWATVHDSHGAFPADYFLQIAIRRFEADYTQGGDPKVQVSLDCTIGRRADRERLASFVAAGSAQASTNRLSAVVAAFENAANTALAAMAERALEAVRADVASRPTTERTPR